MAKHHGHKSHHHGHHKADGGRTHMKVAGNPDVFEEAGEKHGTHKKGGRVHHGKHHHGKKHGGAAEHHHEHHLHGEHHAHKQGHKPRGRKRGGGVGADRSPLSTAHKGTAGAGHGSSEPRDTYGGTPP